MKNLTFLDCLRHTALIFWCVIIVVAINRLFNQYLIAHYGNDTVSRFLIMVTTSYGGMSLEWVIIVFCFAILLFASVQYIAQGYIRPNKN